LDQRILIGAARRRADTFARKIRRKARPDTRAERAVFLPSDDVSRLFGTAAYHRGDMLSDHERCVLRLLSVSWPRAVEIQHGRWVSDPAWDAPSMPFLPTWRFQLFEGQGYHALDWTDLFRMDPSKTGQPSPGEMRGFHVVFRARVQSGGRLVFFDTDGSIIRRNGEIVHEDRDAHPLQRHELDVRFGDCLEIAHWQSGGSWVWGARWEYREGRVDELFSDLDQYRPCVEAALRRPNGPTLKVYTGASTPVGCALAIYSLVLNGYRPADIQVFGDYQWNPATTQKMRTLLPFADVVTVDRVERALNALNPRLVPLARNRWGAMKICVGLFFPPNEYCFLDDDIFVLDRLDDALRLFDTHTFVYAPDCERPGVLDIRHPVRDEQPDHPPLPNVTTGLYLLRNRGDLKAQSERLLSTPPDEHRSYIWEQGFFAWEFSRDPAVALSSQRYFVPLYDGLPGGLHGYDWHRNPCEFACVHFGGLSPKPSGTDAAALIHDILRRHRTQPL
jgi:hypothetical protein